MTLKLTARRVRTRSATWHIYENEMQVPCYSLSHYQSGWNVVAMPGLYGIADELHEMAAWMTGRIHADMTLREALAQVRAVIEAYDAQIASEIAAEQETERRAEAFDDYLAMREEERLAELAFIRNGYDRLD